MEASPSDREQNLNEINQTKTAANNNIVSEMVEMQMCKSVINGKKQTEHSRNTAMFEIIWTMTTFSTFIHHHHFRISLVSKQYDIHYSRIMTILRYFMSTSIFTGLKKTNIIITNNNNNNDENSMQSGAPELFLYSSLAHVYLGLNCPKNLIPEF